MAGSKKKRKGSSKTKRTKSKKTLKSKRNLYYKKKGYHTPNIREAKIRNLRKQLNRIPLAKRISLGGKGIVLLSKEGRLKAERPPHKHGQYRDD